MKFNEKIIELRKKAGLSQEELGQQVGVSRQTVSKWELGQSYPDFQRLVSLSDYFGISMDALVKDIDVTDVRNKNNSEKQLEEMYLDLQKFKKTADAVINGFAIFGIVGVIILLGIILLYR